MTKILVNPTNDSILFNSYAAARMISFCQESKTKFADNDSKARVQQIINDINNYANKTVNVVTQDFQ